MFLILYYILPKYFPSKQKKRKYVFAFMIMIIYLNKKSFVSYKFI